MNDYYETETIEITIKLDVSWEAWNDDAKEYVMKKAKHVFIGERSGAHVDHGCYRITRHKENQ